MSEQPPFRVVPAVDRAVRLLNLLEQEHRPMSISDLARRLDASKGTVRDILETLRHHGLLERDEDTKLYRLGAALSRIGKAARGQHDLVGVARVAMGRLAESIGQPVLLLRPRDASLAIVEKAEPLHPVAPILISATPGRTIPLLAGACGKVILSHLPKAHRDSLLATSDDRGLRFQSDPVRFAEELEQVRASGFAIDDEEYIDGVRGVSAPIFGEDGDIVAVLLVSALVSALSDERMDGTAHAVAGAARLITESLGGGGRERLAALEPD